MAGGKTRERGIAVAVGITCTKTAHAGVPAGADRGHRPGKVVGYTVTFWRNGTSQRRIPHIETDLARLWLPTASE